MQDPNAPRVVKQEATGATYGRSTVVAGGTMALPFAFAEAFDFFGDIWHAIWPQIPDMTDKQCLAMGIIVTGIPVFIASFTIRGTKVEQ